VSEETTQDERIAIRVSRSVYDTVAAVARALGVGVSTAARMLLLRGLENDPLVSITTGEHPAPPDADSKSQE